MSEPLIKLFPEDDFNKNLFLESYIKELKKTNSSLKVEIGMLKSEIDELKDSDDKNIIEQLANDKRSLLIQYRNSLAKSKITKAEMRAIKEENVKLKELKE